MKKSYSLIKAWKMSLSCASPGTYKKLDKDSHFSIFSSLHKIEEPNRYGERVWINEQVENYIKQIRFNREEFFNTDCIDSEMFNSNTYFKSSISSSSSNSSILSNFFRSIWTSEEKINTIDKKTCKKICNLQL